VPTGKTVNSAYIIEALTHFLRVLKEKRPTMAAGNWWFRIKTIKIKSFYYVPNRPSPMNLHYYYISILEVDESSSAGVALLLVSFIFLM
jgi:hypothetical protein